MYATDELVSTLDLRIAETIAKEIETRERELEEQKRAVGAFPTLGASGSSTPTGLRSSSPGLPAPPTAPPQTRKVLSLNPNTKKVTISTFQPVAPKSVVAAATDVEQEEVGVIRVGPPAERQPPGLVRTWRDHGDGRMLYIPPPPPRKEPQDPDQKGKQKSRRKGGKKGSAQGPSESKAEAGSSSTQPS